MVELSNGNKFFFVLYNEDGNDYEYLPCTEENRKLYRDNLEQWRNYNDETEVAPPIMGTKPYYTKLMDNINELKKRGWVQLIEDENNG